MISQTAEYALRAVVCLAQAEGAPRTAETIAATTRVPVGYLAKIMLVLVRAGIVTSQRGIRGGFALGPRPSPLTMLDVIEAVDPLRPYAECPGGPGGPGSSLCPLHRFLDSISAALAARFRAISIASIAIGARFGAPAGGAAGVT